MNNYDIIDIKNTIMILILTFEKINNTISKY